MGKEPTVPFYMMTTSNSGQSVFSMRFEYEASGIRSRHIDNSIVALFSVSVNNNLFKDQSVSGPMWVQLVCLRDEAYTTNLLT
jgi:hypothetical protein